MVISPGQRRTSASYLANQQSRNISRKQYPLAGSCELGIYLARMIQKNIKIMTQFLHRRT